ncbi:hypothetical protein GC194_12890 [bacterium]|nr:hypothetical protein [bacterium]
MPSVDEIFKSGLSNLQIDPDNSVWSKVDKSLGSKEGKVVLPWYYNPRKALIGALLISAMSFSIGYIYGLFNTDASQEIAAQTTHELHIYPQDRPATYHSKAVASAHTVLSDLEKPGNESNAESVAHERANSQQNSGAKHLSMLALLPENERNDESTKAIEAFDERGPFQFLAFSPTVLTATELPEDLDENSLTLAKLNADNLPTADIKHDMQMAGYGRNWLQFNREFNPTIVGYSGGFTHNPTTTVYLGSGNRQSSVSYNFRFGHMLSRNLGLVTGLSMADYSTQIDGKRISFDMDSLPSNVGPSDRYSLFAYQLQYNARMLSVPLMLRIAGKGNRLGYHIDLGAYLSQVISQTHSFAMNTKVDGTGLSNTWLPNMYNSQLQSGLMANAGIDAYLAHGFGFSFEAVLRRRFQQQLLANLNENSLNFGGRVGVFYRF